jgi:cell division protein FtsL
MIFVTIFLIFISVFLLYYVIKLRQTKQEIIKVNVEIAEENDFLEQQHSQLLTEID